jgi:hypothetical protein
MAARADCDPWALLDQTQGCRAFAPLRPHSLACTACLAGDRTKPFADRWGRRRGFRHKKRASRRHYQLRPFLTRPDSRPAAQPAMGAAISCIFCYSRACAHTSVMQPGVGRRFGRPLLAVPGGIRVSCGSLRHPPPPNLQNARDPCELGPRGSLTRGARVFWRVAERLRGRLWC